MDFHIAICDDNKQYRDLITNYIETYNSNMNAKFIVDVFCTGSDLLKQNLLHYQIFILDIEMNDLNGIETATEIRKVNKHGILWFLTVSKEYIMEGYKAEAYKYLLKPLDYDQFSKEFADTIQWMQEKTVKLLTIPYNGDLYQINANDINYIEVLGHKIIYHTDNDVIESIDTLHNIEETLMNLNFYRIHRSFLINLSKVKHLRKTEVIMNNNEHVPLSRHKEKGFRKYYTQVWGTSLARYIQY